MSKQTVYFEIGIRHIMIIDNRCSAASN